MGWGTSWDKPVVGFDIGNNDKTVAVIMKDDKITDMKEGKEAEQLIEKYTNKIPTHDPYTNPNAFLYYECECGNKLDPRTKSFAALNNAASDANWKVRWGPNSYVPYCPKCVKEKGIE